MKKHIFVFAILLCFLFAGKLFAVNDSCLKLLWPDDGQNYNPDFICIDTCKDSPSYGDWFQSGTWTIGFKKFIFKDSLDRGDEAYIKDIDSVNFPEFYIAFKIIEEKFGFLTFHRDPYVCANQADYFFYQAPCLNVFFNRLSRTKDIESYLWKLPDIKFVWMTNWPVQSEVYEKNDNDCLTIKQTTEDILHVNFCDKIIEDNKISIYNVLGECVLNMVIQSREIEIDVSRLEKGIYFVRLGNKLFKIVKI